MLVQPMQQQGLETTDVCQSAMETVIGSGNRSIQNSLNDIKTKWKQNKIWGKKSLRHCIMVTCGKILSKHFVYKTDI